MAQVNKSVSWQAGEGSPIKYIFSLNATAEVVSTTSTSATISLVGTCSVQNYPLNSRNSFAASDIAVLSMGTADPWNYPFAPDTPYYQEPLPFVPSAPQSIIDSVLIQFRGDTWRDDPINSNNRSSLYYKPSGVVLDTYDGEELQTFNINTTFQVDITGGGNIPILVWTDSGATGSTWYEWLNHEVWLSWFDMDYRPGQRKVGGTWVSHNRGVGVCNRKVGGVWTEMRTLNGGVGTDNPPKIKTNGTWYNQKRIGNFGQQ